MLVLSACAAHTTEATSPPATAAPPSPQGIQVIGNYPSTDRTDVMRLRCTVTGDGHYRDCVLLNPNPALPFLAGRTDASLDAHVDGWMSGRKLAPGVQEFTIRFQSASDAGT